MTQLVLLAVPAFAGFDASSVRSDAKRGNAFWGPGAALDSKPDSCWMIDPEADNAGSWIALDVPTGEVDKVAFVIGWDKDDHTFTDYARAKTVRVEVIDSGNGDAVKLDEKFTLEDKRGWQVIDVPNTKVGGEYKGGRVRITIHDVYPGHDYQNLAMSEVRVHLAEFEADTTTLAIPPDSSEPGHGAELAMDKKPATFWAKDGVDDQPVRFTLRAPGYGLASAGITPGPAGYARPKTVALSANGATLTYTMEDKAVAQWFLLPAIVGYTGSAFGEIVVEIVDTYAGPPGAGVAVAELALRAATIDEL
jgi:hypothetical protein